jgi:CBS domain-containing protein
MTIGPDESVCEAMKDMLFGGFRTFPSSSRGAVAGVISMRDLARSMATR